MTNPQFYTCRFCDSAFFTYGMKDVHERTCTASTTCQKCGLVYGKAVSHHHDTVCDGTIDYKLVLQEIKELL